MQINEKAGLTFAAGLRSVLRQDPDVVLVGEVRDTESRELALRASLTGHLVLTTVHTNDAVAALTRFVDMGVAPYLVASSLSLVIAQRLVRVPCPTCARTYRPDDELLAQLGIERADLAGETPRRGTGCRACAESGYLGRRAVFKVLEITPDVRRILLSDPTEAALAEAARATEMITLREHALALARSGGTTFEEVLRTTDRGDRPTSSSASRRWVRQRRSAGCRAARHEDTSALRRCSSARLPTARRDFPTSQWGRATTPTGPAGRRR